MRTCSAPTRTEPLSRRGAWRCWFPLAAGDPRPVRAGGFTLIELLVVISILSLLVGLAEVNLFGVLRRNSFKAQVQDFVSTLQMAGAHAAESDQRYEMIINLAEQTYLLRELTTPDLTSDPLVEQIITQGAFRGNCRCSYVKFDDGTYTNNSPAAKFRAGHAGWQYGGKIVFLDESEQPYAVIVNRLTPIIQLLEGDPPLMTPKAKEEVPFL